MNQNEGTSHTFQETSKQIFRKLARDDILAKKGALEFDWKNKWLKGDEYAHMLKNIDTYSKKFGMQKLTHKTHPLSIYTQPQNGMIYFVEGNSVGSEFGFPRVDIRKRYRWKKMNFTTDLPKRRPYVTYIVASAVKCEKFFPNSKNEGPSYRMHAVILNKNGMQSQRYKIKYRGSLGLESQESNPNSTNSTNCPSLIEDHDRHEISPEDAAVVPTEGVKERVKQPSLFMNDKSYILCHIRKIDSNYKMSKKRKPLQSSEDLYEETMNRKESAAMKKSNASSVAKDDKSGYNKHNNIHHNTQKEERKINFPIMNYYLNTMNNNLNPNNNPNNNNNHNNNNNEMKKPESESMIKKKESNIMKALSGSVSHGGGHHPHHHHQNHHHRNHSNSSGINNNNGSNNSEYHHHQHQHHQQQSNENSSKPSKSMRTILGPKILTKSNNNSSNASSLPENKPSSFAQFNLDELLNHELKRYDNENYDYFKIFNVLINNKYSK